MKIEEIPQDNSSSYGGHNKVLYGVNADGSYATAQSTGWEVEDFATRLAVEEIDRIAEEARIRCKNGESSPLEYFMAKQRMDVVLLSQATGIFQWRIKRHFRPAVFLRLNTKLLQTYSSVLGVDPQTLKTFTG